jgi:hypothetical protein
MWNTHKLGFAAHDVVGQRLQPGSSVMISPRRASLRRLAPQAPRPARNSSAARVCANGPPARPPAPRPTPTPGDVTAATCSGAVRRSRLPEQIAKQPVIAIHSRRPSSGMMKSWAFPVFEGGLAVCARGEGGELGGGGEGESVSPLLVSPSPPSLKIASHRGSCTDAVEDRGLQEEGLHGRRFAVRTSSRR